MPETNMIQRNWNKERITVFILIITNQSSTKEMIQPLRGRDFLKFCFYKYLTPSESISSCG